MAKVKVKLYGHLNLDSKIKEADVDACNIIGVFDALNKQISAQKGAKPIVYKEAMVFINGKRCSNKRKKLKEHDVLWLMSPTIGG